MKGLRTQKRRRKENKTDYKLRLGLLKSGLSRIVIRRTNKYFIAQLIESHAAQDNVLITANSKELTKYSWPKEKTGSLKSIPAGYLTGMLLAKKIKDSKNKGDMIIDLGMTRTLSGSRAFSVVKGLLDSGLKINANEKAFPSEDRISGKHCSDLNETIKLVKSKLK